MSQQARLICNVNTLACFARCWVNCWSQTSCSHSWCVTHDFHTTNWCWHQDSKETFFQWRKAYKPQRIPSSFCTYPQNFLFLWVLTATIMVYFVCSTTYDCIDDNNEQLIKRKPMIIAILLVEECLWSWVYTELVKLISLLIRKYLTRL